MLPKTQIYRLRLGTGRSLFSGADGAVDFGLALLEVCHSSQPGLYFSGLFPKMRRVGLFEIDIWNNRWPKEALIMTVVVV
jgi:hypothetical protein